MIREGADSAKKGGRAECRMEVFRENNPGEYRQRRPSAAGSGTGFRDKECFYGPGNQRTDPDQ